MKWRGVLLLSRADPHGHLPDNILLPFDGAARLTGYGTLALRTASSELASFTPAMRHRNGVRRRSGRYTDVYALATVTTDW